MIKALNRNTMKPLPTYTEVVLGSNLAVIMKNMIFALVLGSTLKGHNTAQGIPKYLRKFMTYLQTFQLQSCLTEIGAFLQNESIPL